jgi:putative ABC transport system permease protein
MAVATAMTLAMGVFGGLFPALRAVRLDVIRALREL